MQMPCKLAPRLFNPKSRIMPTTRSSARIAGQGPASQGINDGIEAKTSLRKRKAENALVKENVKKIAKSPAKTTVQQAHAQIATLLTDVDEEISLLPAVLTFDYGEAKKHLIEVDHRFEDLFVRMKCKPFEHLERAHPFRALATSILGQQISWLAARSIIHKFIRLYNSSLPEKPTDEERRAITFFPTPTQVSDTDVAVLRTAGLSARKAEYIHDLAARFADGRLSTKKLLAADDEELADMLIQVRGIGRWTVDMFAIFSLRRPDILPVGDLGVQKGLLRWFLSLHSPRHAFTISPEKIGGSRETESNDVQDDELPAVLNGDANLGSSVVPTTPILTDDLIEVPPKFTPSIKKPLRMSGVGVKPVPLPPGLDVAILKSRLEGKKKIKGALLSPQEMISLTESWKPYRSLGIYFMWSLTEVA